MPVFLWRAGLTLLAVAAAGAAVLLSLGLLTSGPRPAAARAASSAAAGSAAPGGQWAVTPPPGSPAAPASPHPAGARPSPAPAASAAPARVSLAGQAAFPSAHVRPGYASPADAVDAFYTALLAGQRSQACAYVVSPCPSFGSGPLTGRVTIVTTVTDGRRALVQVTGSACNPVSCREVADVVVMPADPAGLPAAWTALLAGTYGFGSSPLPCEQDRSTGRWHVLLP